MARPSKYKPEYDAQAVQLCKLGATDREVAEFFKVSESTVNLWKIEHPSFSESLKLGKEASDNRVEQSLYRRAVGYSFDAVKISQYQGQEVITPYVEHVAPDVTACIFWLKNRKSGEWRDVRAVDLGRPLEGLTDEQLAIIAEQLRSSIVAGEDQEGTGGKGKPSQAH